MEKRIDLNIQLLRGISIILVVLYHLKLNISNFVLFQGGFLGVDIFFVISGYLITKIILKNINKKNFFSNFFKKRFSRIMPTLSIGILFSVVFSYFLFLPDKLIRIAESSISALTFFSNIYFWKYLNTYNHDEAILNTLLHTWSLSIEVQFYIFFPLLFFIFKKKIHIIKKIILALGLLSFGLANVGAIYEPNINFFGIQSRFWEFSIGILFALRKQHIKIYLTNTKKIIIYIFILAFSLLFTNQFYHPSIFTLLFLIMLSLIYFDQNKKKNLIEKILIFFGTISYSLYIWHFLIFSFFKRFENIYNLKLDFYALALSIIISIVSFKFIENKLRINFKNSFNVVIVCSLISILISLFVISNDGFEQRLSQVKSQMNKIDNDNKTLKYDFRILNSTLENYAKNNVIILGNSHSVQTFQGIKFNKNLYDNFNFYNFHIQIHCIIDALKNNKDNCKGFLDFSEREKFKSGLSSLRNSNIIILSTRWTKDDLQKFDHTVKLLQAMGKKIIIFDNVYDIKKTKINLNKKNLKLIEKNYINSLFYYEQFLALNQKNTTQKDEADISRKYFDNMQKERILISKTLLKKTKINNLDYLNLNNLLCDNIRKLCEFKNKNNSPIYYDDTGHLTSYGNKYLFNKAHTQINSLLNKNVK